MVRILKSPADAGRDDSATLLAWFDTRRRERPVPWRELRDPYAILVAEVMAQQTRVATAAPYHERFLRRFPTFEALAAAEEDEVLREWEGLGYYARARNLRRAARQVVAEHGGRLPDTAGGLRRLPGIGPYTAGAVASIAFDRVEPAVDGNARRVLCRLRDIEVPTPARLDRAARDLLEQVPDRPGALNQALMDLGGEVCAPRHPRCGECPLSSSCLARRRGTVALRPPRRTSAPVPERVRAAAVIERDDRLLVVRRPSTGLLGGLWDFPSAPLAPDQPDEWPAGPADRPTGDASQTGRADALRRGLADRFGLEVRVGGELREVRHTFSHFRLRLFLHRATWLGGAPDHHLWAGPEELSRLAFPIYLRRVIDEELTPPAPA